MGKYKNSKPTLEEDEKIKKVKNDEAAGDYLEYKSVYFAFIDILGFKKEFDDNRGKAASEFSKKYRDVFNYFFELMDATYFMKGNDCYAGQTSDSLYFYTTRSDLLLEFLKIFSHFNLFAMTQNVFFRGGVAKGNLFRKEKHQFYGDSVIYAYLLESVIAKKPVIYIDENTYSELKKCEGYDVLLQAEQGRYYMKPFSGFEIDVKMYIDMQSAINIHEISMEIIKKNIQDNKRMFEYDARNFEKYAFLTKELETALDENEKNKAY